MHSFGICKASPLFDPKGIAFVLGNFQLRTVTVIPPCAVVLFAGSMRLKKSTIQNFDISKCFGIFGRQFSSSWLHFSSWPRFGRRRRVWWRRSARCGLPYWALDRCQSNVSGSYFSLRISLLLRDKICLLIFIGYETADTVAVQSHVVFSGRHPQATNSI